MGQKGPKIQIDIPALEAVIVAANRFRSIAADKATSIRQVCNQMETEESLVGGEGDTIREAFKTISVGITNVENSVDYAVKTLDEHLNKAIKLQKGRMAGSLEEDTASTAKKAGVFKKN